MEHKYGIATQLLSSFGVIGVTVARLSLKNGEVCVYYQALSFKKEEINEFDEKDVFDKIVNKHCPNQDFGCIYCKEGKCFIKPKNVKYILQNLKEKAAFSKAQDNKWQLEL